MIPRFSKRPERIDVCGMNFAAHVFARRMTYCFMLVAERRQMCVAGCFIGRDQIDLVADGLADETHHSVAIRTFSIIWQTTLPLRADRADDTALAAAAP